MTCLGLCVLLGRKYLMRLPEVMVCIHTAQQLQLHVA